MRFLGIGDYCDLSSLYLRLLREGHQVKVFISNPLCRDTLAGFVDHTDDWQAELPSDPSSRAVREYFEVLDDAAFGSAAPVAPKMVSPVNA